MEDFQDVICFALGLAAFFYFTRPKKIKCQLKEPDYKFIEDYEILLREVSESPISLKTRMEKSSLKE